jgi:hypothetical protein
MARKVEIRTSYHSDTRFLLRFQEAIEKDDSMPLEVRQRIIGAVKDIVLELTQLSGRKLGSA